ncbi:hypothetical protein AVEN_228264-1 [Araneus ventricosus]|uniref:Uncharacterized protein n=1 Tax=Araneus ventricosus TaxID=182803 RepID=A0A4Y2TQU4_ARAVE|nr:hypothetical protein AVEN_82980-1 [Araneus ventricosus]GBO01767.1 hypothetical protein AVEN_228264-1 [Araneus ventricosus]
MDTLIAPSLSPLLTTRLPRLITLQKSPSVSCLKILPTEGIRCFAACSPPHLSLIRLFKAQIKRYDDILSYNRSLCQKLPEEDSKTAFLQIDKDYSLLRTSKKQRRVNLDYVLL